MEWLRQTAPQLSLSMDKPHPWLLFDPTQAKRPSVFHSGDADARQVAHYAKIGFTMCPATSVSRK